MENEKTVENNTGGKKIPKAAYIIYYAIWLFCLLFGTIRERVDVIYHDMTFKWKYFFFCNYYYSETNMDPGSAYYGHVNEDFKVGMLILGIVLALVRFVLPLLIKALSKRRNFEKDKLIPETVDEKSFQSDADEIAKFKQLLDNGAITQEEYDAKKKQFLGL